MFQGLFALKEIKGKLYLVALAWWRAKARLEPEITDHHQNPLATQGGTCPTQGSCNLAGTAQRNRFLESHKHHTSNPPTKRKTEA